MRPGKFNWLPYLIIMAIKLAGEGSLTPVISGGDND